MTHGHTTESLCDDDRLLQEGYKLLNEVRSKQEVQLFLTE